jgi:hypothetical protein
LSAAEAQQGGPTEEELRAAYEAELSRLTSTDVIAQATVSLLNIGARRLAPADGDRDPGSAGRQPATQGQPGHDQDQGDRGSTHPQRDLAQARDAIDAVRALLEILERSIPQEVAPLRDALSRLQMAYAREVAPGAAPAAAGQAGAPGGAPAGTPASGGKDRDRAPDPGAEEHPQGPGPAEASGRLWVPGR